MSQNFIKLSANDCRDIHTVLSAKASKLEFTERMAVATIMRKLSEKTQEFESTQNKVDLTSYQTALNAATEKYRKATNEKTIDAFVKDLEILDRKYKNTIEQLRKTQKQIAADSNIKMDVEVQQLSHDVIIKMELSGSEFEILLPIIAP